MFCCHLVYVIEVPMMNGIPEHLRTGDENGYESSVDNDDDISSDDDPEAHKGDSDVSVILN